MVRMWLPAAKGRRENKFALVVKPLDTVCTALKIRAILEAMPSLESGRRAVRRQLERVLESPGFSRNERMSRFLRFMVEGHLDGKDARTEGVRHRDSRYSVVVPIFDSRLDPVVRTGSRAVRARLSQYYLKEGKPDVLVIELPKGGYVPRFREIEEERQGTAPASRHSRAVLALVLAGARASNVSLLGWPTSWWLIQQGSTPMPSRFCLSRTPATIRPTTTLPTGLPMN